MEVEKSSLISQMERRLGRELTPSEKHLIGLAEEIFDDEDEGLAKAASAAQGE